ncbi:MAG: GntR family transcriptional regulator [Burkholderiaceae bacterium]|nr:GntR family transcriptional regulator [Burkholderiaceae bacterium]
MAGEYGISPNIVREALTVLAGEKLVRTQPQQGFAVIFAHCRGTARSHQRALPSRAWR